MDVKVVFNSNSADERLSVGWGVSFLIGGEVLFDTGETGPALMNNIAELDVDLAALKAAVISHDHWDHTGGLWAVLKARKDIPIYACAGFSDAFKCKVNAAGASLVETAGFTPVTKEIYATGEVWGDYKKTCIPEQAVVVDGKEGLAVITGCAHPGVLKILDLVRERFKGKRIYAVFGGFHLMDKGPRHVQGIVRRFRDLGVVKAGPTHCSGTEAEDVFRREYGDDFLTMKAGEILHV